MTKPDYNKINEDHPVTFVHSLFRSGSTYVYNALKSSGKFHVYHEPMHEVIASLPDTWDELAYRNEQLKSDLRHEFLVGGYFDEFSHFLPSIKKTFSQKVSFDDYFLDAGEDAPELKIYIDLLVVEALKTPILQCTRTSGRIGWLKENYESKHVFLLRNPWDQWYSYKVDPYIAITPRIIYSQSNTPSVLNAIFEASKAACLIGTNIQDKIIYAFNHPVTPEQDYFLFFGLWLHSFISGRKKCDVFIDMDELSESETYRRKCLVNLKNIGIDSLDFSGANLHRTLFDDKESLRFRFLEDQVIEIFLQYKIPIEEAIEYLEMARQTSFVSAKRFDATTSGVLIDAYRMRELLNIRDGQVTNLKQVIFEREDQIVSLNQAKSEQEERIATLTRAKSEQEVHIARLNQDISEREDQIVSLNQAKSVQEEHIASLNQAMSDREEQIINLTEETVRRGEWALRLESELKESQISLLSIRQSNSWKITLPLREARRWIDSPIYQTKRYTKAALSLTKRVYQALPLSPKTKAKHRHILTKYFPRILRASGVHHVNVPVLVKPTPMLTEVKIEDIHIIACENPLVSIIIPIYGELAYTLRCLRSISLNLPKVGFEVIVVDDCSADNSAEVIKTIPGVRLLLNTENLGFIRSCNAGASVSAGEYLLFLNNDTEVQPNWMDELLRTFHEFPGTGLAGSKLVYPDGRLQEAGGIIWQDGSAWNFGRFQDPNLPIYNYAREVDYCSGASIMVPKTLFDELNGFDEYYLPAYCEDADLALKIRDKGYRVIYQPQSTVIHYEGITSGTDTTQGTKSYQVENSKKLFERWQNRLANHKAPGTDVDNAKDRKATKRVLVIEHCTPTPNQDAGSVTVFNLMLLLREMDFQVTFIPEDNFLYMPDYTTALQRAGIEALYSPYVTSVEQHLKEYGERYDLAFLFRPGVVDLHLKNIRKYCPKAKILFHTVDLHFLRMSREAALQSDKVKQKTADEMQMRELSAIRAADASIVHSTAELEILKPLLPDASLYVFPLIMDIKGTKKTFSERRDIVFIGGYQHTPNVDAVKYFVDEIMPLLRKQLPGVRFYAVGSNPPVEIQSLASEDVIITGFVDDLTPLLDKMRVSVAPLRYGAGIKGKIGTAMAVGLPVVGTSLAVEGMSLTDGENILVADSAEALANAVTKIYQDEELWQRIHSNGLIFSDKVWGADASWGILSEILDDMSIKVKRNSHPLSLYSRLPAVMSEPNIPFIPIGSVKSRQEYEELLQDNSIKKIAQFEKQLLSQANSEVFSVDGFCVPCDRQVSFLVDMQSGGQRNAHGWTPNWRERLECPLCRMNNRQRLIATLIQKELSTNDKKEVYFMEQVTPIYNWALTNFKKHHLYGSEYLGHEYTGGTIVNGIRHEDVENLSFSDGQLDLIISNDVFEHVPHPSVAFSECVRVLKKGGVMLATIPFHKDASDSVVRAQLCNGELENILPPAYHGNPVSADGSLVFTDFGWDLLTTMNDVGFTDVMVDIYASSEFGHLGGGQFVFRLKK